MKEYLGDSVYAEMDNDVFPTIKLTTNNGEMDNNTIFLEQEVIVVLLAFVEKHLPKLINKG